METEDRLAKALEEQNRLLRSSNRRGGCLWNLIMLILFGVFYIAWLIGKRIVKIVLWALRLAWGALRWTGALIARPFRKGIDR